MPCGPATLATYDLNVGDAMVLLNKENVQVQMDSRPFAKGGCREAYICRVADSSTGFMFGPRMVAKRYLRKDEFVEDYISAHMAQSYAKKFNERNPTKRIRFLVPNKIMTFNGVKYSLEEFLEGRWQKHNNIFGMMESNHTTPAAFSHFTWEASGKKLMILDVQGVGETFTDPAIVSTCQGMYGYTDTGMTGISEFLRTHKCNHICQMVCSSCSNLMGGMSSGMGGRLTPEPSVCGGLSSMGNLGNFNLRPLSMNMMGLSDGLGGLSSSSGCGLPRSPCMLGLSEPMPILRRDAVLGANVLKPLNVAPAGRLSSAGLSGGFRAPLQFGGFGMDSGFSNLNLNLNSGISMPLTPSFGGRIISV